MKLGRELIGADILRETVRRLGAEVSSAYGGVSGELLCVGILNGCYVFFADLLRELTIPVEVAFIRASSYGEGTVSGGDVAVSGDIDVAGRDVLLIDELIDTGHTARRLLDHFAAQAPKTLRYCALLDKPSRREIDVNADFTGLAIEDYFVVGYGLDCAEKWRNLPTVHIVN
ncbi:MAG: hypoxanthine phosphoribosyltransferase [Oscillospiraceae bacterium]|jgi:hypoxanthine phosphoribosyltransferase|nr:hypoxanthine phosphoribosyltransferase [Oscillospiraceae bacterium]